MPRKRIIWLVGLAIAGLLPTGLWAQENDTTMEEVVVTATRTRTALDKVGGSSVTVVTAADIEAKKQTTVEEVIKGVPGLDVVSTGGPGSSTSVFIRGADSKNTLVLIDGIMVNDPSSTNRAADLANLTTDNIERIEVVRGPLSALYGSNATAGVINIITKKGRGKPSLYVGSEYGAYNTWKTYGGASGQWEMLNFSFSAAQTETDGFSAADDRNNAIAGGPNTAEDDGWKNTTLSGKFGVDITDDFDINATVRNISAEVDIDDSNGYAADQWDYNTYPYTLVPYGTKKQKTENDQLFYTFDIHNRFWEGMFDSRFFYKGAEQERYIYDAAGDETNWYKGDSMEAGWQGGVTFPDWNTLSFGYTYFEETLDQTDSQREDAHINSLWASDQLFLLDEALIVVASVRVDDHNRFGTETTWHLAPSYFIEQTGTTFKSSYGTGFRAPSLYEMFAAPILAYRFLGGNEDLDPEKSKGWDAGIEQALFGDRLTVGATYFHTKYEDKIEFVYDAATFTSTYENLEGTTTTKGVEAFVQWAPMTDLSFLLNYTYTDTEDPDGEELVRRPKNKIYFNSRYRLFDRATLNLDVFWVDERKAIASAVDRYGNQVEELDAYFLVNLAASYDITRHVQVYGRIDNLFDEYYEEAWSYATPGFSLYGGVKLTF